MRLLRSHTHRSIGDDWRTRAQPIGNDLGRVVMVGYLFGSNPPPGWASLMIGLLLISGAQMVMMWNFLANTFGGALIKADHDHSSLKRNA